MKKLTVPQRLAKTYEERNAWRAYWTVTAKRLLDFAEQREVVVQFRLQEITAVHEASRCPVPLEEHHKVILSQVFDWESTRGPS